MSSTVGPEASPAADGEPARAPPLGVARLAQGAIREVTGFDGTYEEAVAEGLIDKPPLMKWNRWQAYRKFTATGPTIEDDGWR